VPLVPTHRNAVQLPGPWKAQFFADVAAMDLNSLDTNAGVISDLPSRVRRASSHHNYRTRIPQGAPFASFLFFGLVRFLA
jgi:hypothetical protein